ncbi:VanZ family protein, partial [Candidatus Omnitrophota bacterium]
HHHLYTTKLYVIGALFTMIVALVDEYTQMFTVYRTFSFADIGADFAAGLLGQFSIALILRPELDIWRVGLRYKRKMLIAQNRWIDEKKKSLE